jgi:hypothetical protein
MAITLTVNTNETAVLNVTGSESVGLEAEPSILIDRSTIYEGAMEWTPSAQAQTIEIANKKALDNIVINPIPNNYGLITWNGSILTVS